MLALCVHSCQNTRKHQALNLATVVNSRMRGWSEFMKRSIIIAIAIAAGALVFGFVLFSAHVMRPKADDLRTADAIVVLTGPGNRIQSGADLLKSGRGKRMLITGVNRKISRGSIQRLSRLDDEAFNCCVDLGYEALNTIGNADETRNWVHSNGYKSLLVVTSTYHMPRSLMELSSALPDTVLIPHGVMPSKFPDDSWWLNRATTRTLLSEYLKFIPASIRTIGHRFLRWSGNILGHDDESTDANV